MTSTPLLLPAATPADFFATHVAARQARHDPPDTQPDPAMQWLGLADLLAEDARPVRAAHARMVEEGEPAKAATKYLAGWVGGYLGETVGFVLATTGAGVVADDRARWRLHPHGWPDRMDVSSCPVVVAPDHPWAGLEEVRVVVDEEAVRRAVVTALDTALTPYLQVCRTLAKVGMNSLWAEVADGLGSATAGSPEVAALASTGPTLEQVLRTPGAPWRTRPLLWTATSAVGPVLVARKGGCCLAYTTPGADQPLDDAVLDEEHRAYEERFPRVAGEPAYCATCCFRTPEDVEARQVFWAETQHE